MKNLSNCTLLEFLSQTNKIRNSVAKWLKITDVMNIRMRKPEIPEGATEEETNKLYAEQAMSNINMMLESVLDKHPEETAEVLALCCFIEPKDIDKFHARDFLGSFAEMIGDEEVLRFFGSLMRLGQTLGLTA